MIIRRPGWWFTALFVALIAGSWVVNHAFSGTSVSRVLFLAYAAGALMNLFLTEHRREARPGVVTIGIIVIAALAGGWLLTIVQRWWVQYLLLAFVAAPLMSIANAAFRADVRRAQGRRETAATTLVNDVVAGRPVSPYAVYLRPFITTDRLSAQALPSSLTDPMEVPVHLDLETVLARTVRRQLPLIGLGRTGELDEGIARVVTSDARWRPTMEAMTKDAGFIVMIPLAAHSGTATELLWLLDSGLVARTLFVMPESLYETPGGVWTFSEGAERIFDVGISEWNAELHMLDLPKEWMAAVQEARDHGIELPQLAACGALFTVDPATRAVRTIVPLGLSTLCRSSRYLRWVLTNSGVWPASRFAGELERVLAESVLIGGKTLEFALVRAADGLAVWGDADGANRLLRRAAIEGRPRSSFVSSYLSELPSLAAQRDQLGDAITARRYEAFSMAMRADPQLSALAPVS